MHPAAVAGGSPSWLNNCASASRLTEGSYCYLAGDQELSVSQNLSSAESPFFSVKPPYFEMSDEIHSQKPKDFTDVGNNDVSFSFSFWF